MSKSSFWFGIIVGAAAGALAVTAMEKRPISSEKALAIAKQLFEEGALIGSWILHEMESFDQDGTTYSVYRGGLSTKDSYTSFLIDAFEGKLLAYDTEDSI